MIYVVDLPDRHGDPMLRVMLQQPIRLPHHQRTSKPWIDQHQHIPYSNPVHDAISIEKMTGKKELLPPSQNISIFKIRHGY